MQSNDDLVIQIFFWTCAFLAMVEAMKATGWRLWAFGILGGLLFLIGTAWAWVKEIYPPFTGWITTVATSPHSWFLLIVLFLVLVAFTGRAKKVYAQGGGLIRSGEFDALNEALQGLLERVSQIEQRPPSASAEDHDKLVTTVVNLTKDTNARVERLLASPKRERDILLLMHFAVYQSTVLMLDDLLNSAPDGITIDTPLSVGGDFALKNAQAKDFIDLIRRKMDPGSWRRNSFEGAMNAAENEAEYALEQTPINERPGGIDPLALRRWAIAHRQCAAAILFLNKEKREAAENLLNQRHDLLQLYTERNKI